MGLWGAKLFIIKPINFFFTKRSLYALVVDSRKEHDCLDYWLNIVEILSDNSPMLIIKNEKDKCSVDLKE